MLLSRRSVVRRKVIDIFHEGLQPFVENVDLWVLARSNSGIRAVVSRPPVTRGQVATRRAAGVPAPAGAAALRPCGPPRLGPRTAFAIPPNILPAHPIDACTRGSSCGTAEKTTGRRPRASIGCAGSVPRGTTSAVRAHGAAAKGRSAAAPRRAREPLSSARSHLLSRHRRS